MTIITGYLVLDSILILIISIVIASYYFMTRKFNYWKKRGVYEVKPVPFFGNFADCLLQKQTPGLVIKDFYNVAKKEPYVGFYIFDKPCLLIRDREIIKDILVKDFHNFADHHSVSSPEDRLGSSSLFLMKNPTWKTVRTKLTPIFTTGKLKRMFDLLLECTVNLDTYLDKKVVDGKDHIIDLRDLCGNLATDMIGITAYGINIDAVNNPTCEFRERGRSIFDVNIFRGLELFLVFFYPQMSRFMTLNFFGKETTGFLRKVFWDTINHRIASGQKRGDLIDILIDFRKEYANQDLGNFKFDGDDLVAQAAIFFTGGFETSSSAMSFTFYELAMNPDIQNKLRKEILDELDKNGGKITYDMVLTLPYLEMVVCETLRMYPILGVFDRETLESYQMPNSNLVLEKGTPIYISIFGMHYDPEYFPNPNVFNPERFSEENKRKIPQCAYMPFGEGPRTCIGKRLGLLQTKLGIIKVLSNYEVTPCKDTLIPMIINPMSPVTAPMGNKLCLNVRRIKTSAK